MSFEQLESTHPPPDGSNRAQLRALTVLFVLVTVLAGVDLLTDVDEGVDLGHWLVEGSLLALGLAGSVMMFGGLRRLTARARSLRVEAERLTERLALKSAELVAESAEAERWREETRTLLRGLGEAIDRQFERWALSAAEKEVGLLLLKGLAHKEIAGVRGTSDATTRQQARAVYKKAGLSGRNDLAAFFLEDLLLPVEDERATG